MVAACQHVLDCSLTSLVDLHMLVATTSWKNQMAASCYGITAIYRRLKETYACDSCSKIVFSLFSVEAGDQNGRTHQCSCSKIVFRTRPTDDWTASCSHALCITWRRTCEAQALRWSPIASGKRTGTLKGDLVASDHRGLRGLREKLVYFSFNFLQSSHDLFVNKSILRVLGFSN